MNLIEVNSAQNVNEDDPSHMPRGASMVFRATEKYIFVGHQVLGKHAASVEPQMSSRATVPIHEQDAGPLNEALLIKDEEVVFSYIKKYIHTRSLGHLGFTHTAPNGARLPQSSSSAPLIKGFNEIRRPARWSKD
jgi:hypothetical protein